MAARVLGAIVRHEDLHGIVVFCAGVGQSGHFPRNLPTKGLSIHHHKIFFIRLESLYTVEFLVRSEGIARGAKA